MADSPQRLRLDTAIDSADPGGIGNAANQWTLLKSKLTYVADTLEKAQGVDIRGLTGDSMRGAFGTSAKGVREKVTRLEVGRSALEDAARAQERARTARTALDSDPALALGTAPTAFQPDPDKTPAENQTARGLHQGETDAYWDRHARREAEAKRIADQLDRDYADAAEKMKQIHGEPDPVKTTPDTGNAGGGGGGGVPRGGGRAPGAPSGPRGGFDPSGPGHPTGDGPRDPSGPRDSGEPTRPPHPPTSAPTAPSGTSPSAPLAASDTVSPAQAGSSTTGGGLPGGAAGGMAAGIAGGLGVRGLTNAIRGGLASPGQATRAGSVRPIGSTSRSAVSGTLGRAGGAPAGSTARSAAGGSGAGRGAAGRAGAAGQASGQRGGGRSGTAGRAAGARGGAGAGGAGAGRGRGSKDRDEESVDDDLFDDGQDWIDDADAASGVLD